MKNTLSPPEKTFPKKNWMGHIRRTVEAALLSAGILSGTLAHAQESDQNTQEKTPLEQAQKLNQFYLGQDQEMKETFDMLWSQLVDIPGTPRALFDDSHNITPEAKLWVRSELPEKHIKLVHALETAQNQRNSLVGVALVLALALIAQRRGRLKDKELIATWEERFFRLEEKLSANDASVAIDQVAGEEATKNADKAPLSREKSEILSQLEKLSINSLLILTPTEGDPWYIYAIERNETPAGTEWTINTKNKGFKMHITAEGEIELEYVGTDGPQKYTTALSTFRSLEIIDTANTESKTLDGTPPPGSSQKEINTYYLGLFGISRDLVAGEKLFVHTKTPGSAYILEVQENGNYRILSESPMPGFEVDTVLSGFNSQGGLKKFSGRATNRIVCMVPLKQTVNTPVEEGPMSDSYTPPSSDEIQAMDYSALQINLILLVEHARARQSEEAPSEELARYQELIGLFNQRILKQGPKPEISSDLQPENMSSSEKLIENSFLSDTRFGEVKKQLLSDIKPGEDPDSPLSIPLLISLDSYQKSLKSGIDREVARGISILSREFISFLREKQISEDLIRSFAAYFGNAHKEFGVYIPVIGEPFNNRQMVQIGRSQMPILRVSKILSLGIRKDQTTLTNAEVECK